MLLVAEKIVISDVSPNKGLLGSVSSVRVDDEDPKTFHCSYHEAKNLIELTLKASNSIFQIRKTDKDYFIYL